MVEILYFLVYEYDDNVGVVVVEGLIVGIDMLVCVIYDNFIFCFILGMDVFIGYKIVLKDFKEGDIVIKYGEDIGKIIVDIVKGDYVYIYNCKIKCW